MRENLLLSFAVSCAFNGKSLISSIATFTASLSSLTSFSVSLPTLPPSPSLQHWKRNPFWKVRFEKKFFFVFFFFVFFLIYIYFFSSKIEKPIPAPPPPQQQLSTSPTSQSLLSPSSGIVTSPSIGSTLNDDGFDTASKVGPKKKKKKLWPF